MADGTHVPRALAVVWFSGPQAASYLAVHGGQMESCLQCGKSGAQFTVGALGGVRDLAYSSRLHLLTTSLLQGTPFLRLICSSPPPKFPADQSVTRLGFRVTRYGDPSR